MFTKRLMLAIFSIVLFAGGINIRAADQPAAKAVGKAFSVEITNTDAWSDHMPGGPGRRFLIISVKFTNTSKEALDIDLAAAFISSSADQKGQAVKGIKVRDAKTGGLGDGASVKVKAGDSVTIDYRGENVFDARLENKTLYVTLELKAAGETLTARGSANVLVTQ